VTLPTPRYELLSLLHHHLHAFFILHQSLPFDKNIWPPANLLTLVLDSPHLINQSSERLLKGSDIVQACPRLGQDLRNTPQSHCHLARSNRAASPIGSQCRRCPFGYSHHCFVRRSAACFCSALDSHDLRALPTLSISGESHVIACPHASW
jgi:hypothetical protein